MAGDTEFKPFNEYYELMSFETTHLVQNSGSNIEIWVSILLLGLISAQIYRLLKNTFMKIVIVFVDFKIRYMVIV